MTTDQLPLRERKRRATLVAIEDAATALVLDAGIDAVTVDDICARAHISRRTFFNYVDSKEAAVVGSPPRDIGETDAERFSIDACRDGNVVESTLRLLLAVVRDRRVGDAEHSSTVMARRRRIFHAHPELATARQTAFAPLHRTLAELVRVHLERFPQHRRLPDLPCDVEAKAVVAVVVTASNMGMTPWLAKTDAGIEELDRECLVAIGRLVDLVSVTPPASTSSITHSSEEKHT